MRKSRFRQAQIIAMIKKLNRPGFTGEQNSPRMDPITQRKPTPTYTAEFRARGIRLFKENRANYPSDNAAYRAIASKLGCSPDSLRAWRQQSEHDTGTRDGLSSEDKGRLKALERENRELRKPLRS